ncbi:NAD(P)/FAD-dependent oxidoreductase [Haladaptatus sp. NG-WS-4]
MSYDVIIVGSGCAGLSAAYRLAPDHDVLIVDRAGIGEGTSSRASGVITAPVDYPDLPEWSAHATEFFRELDGTGTFTWTDRPYVRGVRPEDVDESETYAEPDDVSLVDAAEYDNVFDADAPYSHALVWEDCGYCDVDEFLATLHKEATDRGAEFRPDTTVESVIVEDGAVIGVETTFGEARADTVVVAAGFHGAGVMATDSIGTAIRARVTGEDAPFSLAPFRLDRFDTRDTDFPFSTLFQASS